MKTIILVFIMLPLFTLAQRIKVDKYDEFTKHHIIETSWFTIKSNLGKEYKCRLSRSDSSRICLELSMVTTGSMVYSINKGDELMLKLDNDTIVMLYNDEYVLSSISHGYNSVSSFSTQNYFLNNNDIKKILNHKVLKFRVYTSKEYFEIEIMNEENQIKLSNAIKLFNLNSYPN